jgi:very-short-patch-repair endonuclease
MPKKQNRLLKRLLDYLFVAHEGSELEEKFFTLWKNAKGCKLAREIEFWGDKRYESQYKKLFKVQTIVPWRFDFGIKKKKIAIEIEGHPRHYSPEGYKRDCIKYNQAIKYGWVVYRIPRELVRPDYVAHLVDAVKNHRRYQRL